MDEMLELFLNGLANEISTRIEAGHLPHQDASGQYILDGAAVEVSNKVLSSMVNL